MKNKPFKANKIKSGNKAPDRTRTGVNKPVVDNRHPNKKQTQTSKS